GGKRASHRQLSAATHRFRGPVQPQQQVAQESNLSARIGGTHCSNHASRPTPTTAVSLSRDSPNESCLAWMVAIFWIGRKPRCEVSMASASQTVRTALEGLIWPIFPDIGRHSSGVLALNARPSDVLR